MWRTFKVLLSESHGPRLMACFTVLVIHRVLNLPSRMAVHQSAHKKLHLYLNSLSILVFFFVAPCDLLITHLSCS